MSNDVQDPTDAVIERRLRATFETVMPMLDNAGQHAGSELRSVLSDRSTEDDLHLPATERERRAGTSRALAVAVTTALLVGVAGALVATRNAPDDDPVQARSSVPAATNPLEPDGSVPPPAPAPPVAFVLDALPDDLQVTSTGLSGPYVRDEPSAYVSNEYGSAANPLEPSQMVHIEYSPRQSGTLTCFVGTEAEGVTAVEPFTVTGQSAGRTCMSNGLVTANWTIEPQGIAVVAMGGSAVTRDRLVELVQSLTVETIAPPADGLPAIRLVPNALPVGWVPLVSGDAPFEQRITEANWVATAGGVDGSPNQLLVSTWSGLDDERGALVRHPAIQAERITVRGHDGYRFLWPVKGERGPIEIQIWWIEQPGVVVSVWATDVAEPDVLMQWIEQLRPVDSNGAAEFFATHD